MDIQNLGKDMEAEGTGEQSAWWIPGGTIKRLGYLDFSEFRVRKRETHIRERVGAHHKEAYRLVQRICFNLGEIQSRQGFVSLHTEKLPQTTLQRINCKEARGKGRPDD